MPHARTLEAIPKITGFILEGHSLRMSCQLLGLVAETYYAAMKRGREDIEEGKPDTADAGIYRAIKTAEAKRDSGAIACAYGAAKEDPRYAFRWLGIHRVEYGENVPGGVIETTGPAVIRFGFDAPTVDDGDGDE